MPKQKDGCAIFMRRTFLFFIALAIAKLLKEYFSIAQNRANFWSLMQNLKQTLERKYISWRNGTPVVTSTPTTTPEKLPSPTLEDDPVVNGTFFSKDEEKRVMGNMVAGGKFLKYSQWKNYATTLGIKAGNQLEMVTAREQGQPDWSQHWFSLTCGPRLVKDDKIWLKPELEGFRDPHVFDTGGRTAIGYPQSGDKIYLVTFLSILSLEDEAKLMQGIGCHQAMNLDGGASRSLAYRNKIIVPAGRSLTNVILVYDTQNPAPIALQESWRNFQQQPQAINNLR